MDAQLSGSTLDGSGDGCAQAPGETGQGQGTQTQEAQAPLLLPVAGTSGEDQRLSPDAERLGLLSVQRDSLPESAKAARLQGKTHCQYNCSCTVPADGSFCHRRIIPQVCPAVVTVACHKREREDETGFSYWTYCLLCSGEHITLCNLEN